MHYASASGYSFFMDLIETGEKLERTIDALTLKCEKAFDLREQKSVLAQEIKGINEELEKLTAEILETLEASELDGFDAKSGRVSVKNYFGVRTPKTEAQKKELFRYLQEKGIYWELVGVNSQSLNSFYNSEMEEATERGDLDFKIPGLEEPTLSKDLTFRRKTK